MKIELDIDPSQIGQSVQEMINSLSEEQRLAIARDVLTQFIHEPGDIERELYKQTVVDQIRKENIASGRIHNNNSDEAIRSDYHYRDRLKKFVSVKERMIGQLVESCVAQHAAIAQKLILEDPKIRAMLDAAAVQFARDFPAMCQKTMNAWFVSHLREMSDQHDSLIGKSFMHDVSIEELSARMSEV